MHACLCIDEIVRLIAWELVGSGGEATAVALACCHKGFEDPALDVLWENRLGVTELLKTLPEDVWDSHGYMVCSGNIIRSPTYPSGHPQSLRRLPTKLEWIRLQEYARRIRTLADSAELIPLQILRVLQSHASNEPFLPNLNSLDLWDITEDLIPLVSSFLSPRITSISLSFECGHPKAAVFSFIKILPTLCPNLQKIDLQPLSEGPEITVAISEMLLVTNRDILQKLHVDSPLTKAANELFCKLPNLRDLQVILDGPGPLPTFVLPNLTTMAVEYDDNHDWLEGFRGATLGKLSSFTSSSGSSTISDFLETFESVTPTTSISATLSEFYLYGSRSGRPNYRSLLQFTRLKKLRINFPCGGDCPSTIDDHIITDLARAMPELEILHLGAAPCNTASGITIKGLAALAHYCLRLSQLCVHFQVTTLDPPTIRHIVPGGNFTMPREDCALTDLEVGGIHLSEGSALMVALTLLRIFPRLKSINYLNPGWEEVARAIRASKGLVDRSSKGH